MLFEKFADIFSTFKTEHCDDVNELDGGDCFAVVTVERLEGTLKLNAWIWERNFFLVRYHQLGKFYERNRTAPVSVCSFH